MSKKSEESKEKPEEAKEKAAKAEDKVEEADEKAAEAGKKVEEAEEKAAKTEEKVEEVEEKASKAEEKVEKAGEKVEKAGEKAAETEEKVEEAREKAAEAEKKPSADKEKPLEKMTVKELREVAKDIPGIVGVHGMKKDELISEIKKAKGIAEEPVKKAAANIAELKQKIKTLKVQRREALEAKDKKKATIFKRQISRLKKKTRRAAA
ncbi:MAG: Rho termination factor N-terminal domain-containing protein [Desulfobacterales bacterium]